jgi:AcrR family transcriptional regulator
VPPPNGLRRAQIALPAGTASNYFRSREALLVAVTQRVAELHQADMTDAAAAHVPKGDPTQRTVGLIAASLHHAATAHRDRYLALFELRLESLRRPALAEALDQLMNAIAAFTTAHHAELRLDIPPAAVPQLMVLYGGALFTLVTAPPSSLTETMTRDLATAIVRGALS